MANIIKQAKMGKKTAVLGSKINSGNGLKKNTDENPNIKSLDFDMIITSEIQTVHQSISRKVTRQSENYKREMKELSRQAKEDGYNTGFAEAVEKERSGRINAVDRLLKEAKKKNENAIRGLELKVIDLAVFLAEQITRKSLSKYPEIIEEIIRETMSYLIGNESIVLKVSEEDFKLVNSRYDKWMDMAGSTREFRLEVDRRLKPGDCIIETEGGIIDSIVAHRLETIAEELIKVSS